MGAREAPRKLLKGVERRAGDLQREQLRLNKSAATPRVRRPLHMAAASTARGRPLPPLFLPSLRAYLIALGGG